MRICVLDDVEGAALASADWGSLTDVDELRTLREHVDDVDSLVTLLQPYDVVVVQRERTPLPRDVLAALPRLRLVVTTGPVNRTIDVAAAAELGITVSATTGGRTPVAELAWALILAAFRDIPGRTASMRDGGWQPTLGRELAGGTLGLIGLGRTGSVMARIGSAFGMDVVAWSANLTDDAATARGARLVPFDVLLGTSDVVSIHTLLSRRTHGLVGAEELRRMRPTSWLVNTSRGPIVDEGALVQACREGWIAGAGLDVFDVEPLAADHPLRSLPNVLLTPHVGYVSAQQYRDWYRDVVESIAAWQRGEPVRVIGR